MSIQILFIGSYAPADKPGIYAFRFGTETGALDELSRHSGIAKPSFLVVHPNGEWVYTVSELGLVSDKTPGSVHALAFNHAGNTFQHLNFQSTDGDWPCHLALHVSRKWLFVANYGTGSMSVFPVLADGTIGPATDHVQHDGQGPDTQRQEGPHAHSTTLTPDKRFAIVADLGTDHLVMYALDAANGKLQLHGQTPTPPGSGPRHVTFHPNGRVLYAANELANTVGVYRYDDANGTLTETQMLATLPADAPPNTVADIHLSAGADRLYVSNRGHDSIAVYAVDAEGAVDSLLGTYPCGGKTPRNFALAPGGKFMLVANQDSDNVSVLPLRDGTDEIGVPIAQIPVPTPSCIQFVMTHA